MDIRPNITAIEAALKERGISVARICRRADLAPTTWVRWKNGAPAQARSWDRVTAVLVEINPGWAELAAPRAEAA